MLTKWVERTCGRLRLRCKPRDMCTEESGMRLGELLLEQDMVQAVAQVELRVEVMDRVLVQAAECFPAKV